MSTLQSVPLTTPAAPIFDSAPRQLLWGCIRVIVTYAVLTTLALLFAENYGRAMLPVYKWVMGIIAPKYEIVRSMIMDKGVESFVAMGIRDNNTYYVQGQFTPPGTFAHAVAIRTLSGLQQVVLLLLLPLSWPGIQWRRRLLALACVFPFLVVMELLDTPLELVSKADGDAFSRYGTPATWIMQWVDIWSSGGRFALSLFCGFGACFAALRISNYWDEKKGQESMSDRFPLREFTVDSKEENAGASDARRLVLRDEKTEDDYALGRAIRWEPVTTYRLQVEVMESDLDISDRPR